MVSNWGPRGLRHRLLKSNARGIRAIFFVFHILKIFIELVHGPVLRLHRLAKRLYFFALGWDYVNSVGIRHPEQINCCLINIVW